MSDIKNHGGRRAGAGRPKGLPKSGGRKKGTGNHDTAKLRAMIMEALSEAGGVKYLTRQATESPAAFLALVGKVLPTEHTGPDGGPITVEIVRLAASAHSDPP